MLADHTSNIYRNTTEYNSTASANILEGLYEFLKAAELEHYFEDLNGKLKVRSIAQLKYVDETDFQNIGMTRPEMRRLKKYFAKEFPQTAMGKIKKRLSRTTSNRSTSVPRPEDLSNRMNSFSSRVTGKGTTQMDSDELATIASVTNFSITSNGTSDSSDWRQLGSKHLILHNQLTLEPIIQHGDFGDIYKGNFRSSQVQIQVAVKVVNKLSLKNDVNDFVREIFGNCYLDHQSLARLYGISIDDYSIKMVTELTNLGSLSDNLLGPESKIKYPVTVLHSFFTQISDAMSYLEERRVIHGRLYGRNILMFPDNKVKVTDAGLFRAYSQRDQIETFDTCLWLAPELQKGCKETLHSDVWAFSVLLWEICSYYQHPPSSQLDESMSSQMDMRLSYLPQPDLCPNMIYQLMQICWVESPKERPTFHQLFSQVIRLEPEQLAAMVDGPDLIPSHRPDEINEPSDGSYSSLSDMQMLYYKADDTIIVLDRSMSQYKELWRGCLLTGESGYFKWSNMRAFGVNGSANNDVCQPSKTKVNQPSPATSVRSNGRNIGEALSKIRISRREDKKKQSRLSIDMISGPQNDFRHVGHVGANGDVFGDVTSLYSSSAQEKKGSASVSTRSDNSSVLSEASSVISSRTLNAAGDDTPPYATLDSEPNTFKSDKSKKSYNKSLNTTTNSVRSAPPLPPVRGCSDEESNSNTYLDDLNISNNYSLCNESLSMFDELSKHWEMQYSKLETPTSEKVVNIAATEESPSRKSPTSNTDYSEVYDVPQRSNSNCTSMNKTTVEPKPQNNTPYRHTSFMSPVASNGTGSVKTNIFQRVFGTNKPVKTKDGAEDKKSPVYAKVSKTSKTKKQKDVNESKKNIISKPILISGPVPSTNDCVDDSFLDCSSEVSSLQPSPRDSVLCLAGNGFNSYGIMDPSPSFNRQYSNITNNSRGKTSDSTITSVSSASSFASLTSPVANNVMQGGAALRALRRGDCVFRASSAVNAMNRKRPSMGQIQLDQYSNEGTMSRTRQPSLPLTSTIDRRNTLRTRADNYDQLDGVVDSSATTPIASELPDLPYIDLSFVRTVTLEKVNPGDDEDAYNSLHSGSLGSDTIEPRSFSKQTELFSNSHTPFHASVKDDKSDSTVNKMDFYGRSKQTNDSKCSYNFTNSANIFTMNGDNDEVAL